MTDEYNKKVVYMENDRIHADLKLKIHYDGITQADFFRGCVRAYLEEEGAFMAFLGKLKEQRTKQAKRVRAVANKGSEGAKAQRPPSLIEEPGPWAKSISSPIFCGSRISIR